MNELINSTTSIPDIIAIGIFVCVFGSCRTTNPIPSSNTNTVKPHDSVLIDSDGNRYPVKVLSDGNLWMTANLKLNIANSYCYDDVKENCERYGRLYTWESAKQGCKLLGNGWRLPAREEWRQLRILYGGIAADSILIRKEAYKTLLYTGTSGFNALLGGGRTPDGQYARGDAHGFYWTATEKDNSIVWFYNFAKGSQALFEQDGGEKTRAFSVRCVKSGESLK